MFPPTLGLHAGTEESKRVTARVYGDGSLPFELRGEKVAKLSWTASEGSVSGSTPYVHIRMDLHRLKIHCIYSIED